MAQRGVVARKQDLARWLRTDNEFRIEIGIGEQMMVDAPPPAPAASTQRRRRLPSTPRIHMRACVCALPEPSSLSPLSSCDEPSTR